jgi:hypothetical protein
LHIQLLGKLFSKVLATHLALMLDTMVHHSQSTFIQGWFIHDNFRYVQDSAKALHIKKVSSVLLKVDIARAFDSVSWSFLFEIMAHMGFSSIWIDWLLSILSSASTKVLMNGHPGNKIFHACGHWQGDSLSMILFILVMEVLSALICKANSWSLFAPLWVLAILHRASFYTDDLVIFLNPV